MSKILEYFVLHTSNETEIMRVNDDLVLEPEL